MLHSNVDLVDVRDHNLTALAGLRKRKERREGREMRGGENEM